MAKGAAKEDALGKLHVTLTNVFIKVLEKYEADLTVSDEEIDDEVAETILATEPNPAMLSAISKFLKDNEIMYDTEELNKLSATERRLQELKQARGSKVVDLAGLPVADNG